MILLFPTLIKGINKPEAQEKFKPTCHMFYPQRVTSFKGDGVVKWAGLDNNSDLLDDDGNVLVKFEEGMEEKDINEAKRKKLKLNHGKHFPTFSRTVADKISAEDTPRDEAGQEPREK